MTGKTLGTASPVDATIVTSADASELSPIESAIMDGCNELHEAVWSCDASRVAGLRAELDGLLARYESSDGEDHPNPRWAIPNQRALVESASGEVARAVLTERVALEHADTARRLEISLGNNADRCIRLGRYEAAVGYFLRASEHAPDSVPVLLTGVQALAYAGACEQAELICAAMLRRAERDPSLLGATTELGAYLRFETRLRSVCGLIPSLSALLDLCDACVEGGDA